MSGFGSKAAGRVAKGFVVIMSAATVVGGLSVLASGAASAITGHTYTVNVNGDTSDSPTGCTSSPEGTCSLRDALNAVADDSSVTSDTINFASSTSGVPFVLGAGGTLHVGNFAGVGLTINGNGATNTVIDGNDLVQVMYVNSSAAVTITGVTIQHGSNEGEGGGLGIGGSCGIPITLTSSVVSGNTAGSGGGIYVGNCDSLTITDSTIGTPFGTEADENTSTDNGGGLLNDGTLVVKNSTFASNDAGGSGGAIANQGKATITNSTIGGSSLAGNTAVVCGGGISNAENLELITPNTPNTSGTTLNLTNTTMNYNQAGQCAGGLINNMFSSASITGGSVSDNAASAGEGGGIMNEAGLVNITGTVVEDNASQVGGGIFSSAGSEGEPASLKINQTTVSRNSAFFGGGGIFNNCATLTITGSSVDTNQTGGFGGGIFNTGFFFESPTEGFSCNNTEGVVAPSTSSGSSVAPYQSAVPNQTSNCNNNPPPPPVGPNSQTATFDGKRLFYGAMTVTNSDISRNTACAGGGGVFSYEGKVNVAGSTVNDNAETNCTGEEYCGGGGIWSEFDASFAATGDTFNGNTGAFGGALFVDEDVSCKVTGGSFANNSSYVGGAIFNAYDGLTVDGTTSGLTFLSNSATFGGAITNGPESGMVIKGAFTFENNSAEYGGAISNQGDMTINGASPTTALILKNSAGQGGGIYTSYSLALNSTSVIYNTASEPKPSGGGVFIDMGSFTKNATTVVAHNTPDQIAP